MSLLSVPATPASRRTMLMVVSAVVVVNSPPTTPPTSHCHTPASRAWRPEMRRPHWPASSWEEVMRPSSHTRPPPTE